MITADQLLAHAIGDYVLQSDWMATKKRTDSVAAAVHAFVYGLCFLPFLHHVGTRGLGAWAVIVGTHFLIDRFGLARYVVWAKNFLAPPWMNWGLLCECCGHEWQHHLRAAGGCTVASCGCGANGDEPSYAVMKIVRTLPWRSCQKTGYPPGRPDWLAVWLLIVADNVLHVVINGLALRFL